MQRAHGGAHPKYFTCARPQHFFTFRKIFGAHAHARAHLFKKIMLLPPLPKISDFLKFQKLIFFARAPKFSKIRICDILCIIFMNFENFGFLVYINHKKVRQRWSKMKKWPIYGVPENLMKLLNFTNFLKNSKFQQFCITYFRLGKNHP